MPKKIITNKDLENIVDTSDEWITARTGIKSRFVVTDETNSDLAYNASLTAIERAGISKDDIGAIIVATSAPDMIFPSTACMVQNKLKIDNCAAFDVSAACTGFVYALSIASGFFHQIEKKYLLLIGTDVLTKMVDWKDRSTCILFGDGAGALILEQVDKNYGIIENHLSSDGSGWDILYIPAGGTTMPATSNTVENRMHYIKMNGREVFKFAVNSIVDTTNILINKANVSLNDIKYIIPHQANKRIIKSAAAKLNITDKKLLCNIENYGNTSNASIPLVLDELVTEKKLKKDDLIITIGFGAGLTWGGNLIRWS